MTVGPLDTLTQAIEKIIEEKTFSVEGVKAIEALRVKAAELEKTLADERSTRKMAEKINEERATQITGLLESLNAYKNREKTLEEREKKITELEKTTAVAQAESRVLENCFDKIFKNTIVRENVQRNHSTYDSRTGSSQNDNHSEDRTTTQSS